MTEKIKIKLEELTEDSTPCEICVAMNSREVEKNEQGDYFDGEYCTYIIGISDGGTGCSDVDKARLKMEFLNYLKHKSK